MNGIDQDKNDFMAYCVGECQYLILTRSSQVTHRFAKCDLGEMEFVVEGHFTGLPCLGTLVGVGTVLKNDRESMNLNIRCVYMRVKLGFEWKCQNYGCVEMVDCN